MTFATRFPGGLACEVTGFGEPGPDGMCVDRRGPRDMLDHALCSGRALDWQEPRFRTIAAALKAPEKLCARCKAKLIQQGYVFASATALATIGVTDVDANGAPVLRGGAHG